MEKSISELEQLEAEKLRIEIRNLVDSSRVDQRRKNVIQVTSLVVALSIVIYTAFSIYDRNRELQSEIITSVEGLSLKIDNTSETNKRRNSEKYLNLPSVSFHFANKDQIEIFYNEYFKEPTVESLIREITRESSDNIETDLGKVIQAQTGGKDISKWIETIKLPETTLNGMFLKYQNQTIINNQVLIGLEELDVELDELNTFRSQIQNFRAEYSYNFDNTKLKQAELSLKEKAAENTIKKLSDAKGSILIEGRFLINKRDNFYKIIIEHPVNEYLNQEEKILISCLVPIEKIESSYAANYSNSVGRKIPLRIYGKVWQPVEIENGIFDLQIIPWAIY